MKPRKQMVEMIRNHPGVDSKTLCRDMNMVYAEIWTLGAELQKKGLVEFKSKPGKWKQMRWYPTNKDLLS
jgi:hypothetical protein